MNNLLVSASHLKKHFGDVQAVSDVSLQIKPGEIYGLVGADGAGKTTTIRLLVGALKADAGEVHICGYDINKQTEQARSQFGYLSQRFSLYEDLTVLENIRFFAEVRGLKPNEWLPRCLEILEFVGLEKFTNRKAGQLSGGMKQKLGLASALVTKPRVLLLDEPTTGVDPVTRQDFWQLVIKLVSTPLHLPPNAGNLGGVPRRDEGGVAVLISTPYMDEASRCHRVGFMKDGKLIAEDTPSNLRARLNGRILELRGSPLGLLRHIAHQDEDVEDVQAFGDRLHLRVGEGKAQGVLSRLKSRIRSEGGRVDELRSVPPVLEDVFIALSSSHLALKSAPDEGTTKKGSVSK
ncbi:MAG: ATP-binding cassette domain-containing protein [Chloroflexota bacterium]|nr:ABC transporter ATP-binding protein [Chloroflexota bacterium]MBI5705163.1 ABC transporter ATP-binding protein [Chloroflexota bacterium]